MTAAKSGGKHPDIDEAEEDGISIEIKEEEESGKGSDEPECGKCGEDEEDIAAKLAAAEAAEKESYDRFLRVSADFENYKKRSSREMSEFRKYANESLIRDLLPIVDNLERAIVSASDHKDIDSFVEGVNLTFNEVMKVLERFSVKPIDAVGMPFDPTYHQAVMQEPDDDKPENTIIRELQKGYTIHDRLLRPTMVVVSKPGKTDNDRQESDSQQDTSEKEG